MRVFLNKCIFVFMQVCVHVCMLASSTYIPIYLFIYLWMYVCKYVSTYATLFSSVQFDSTQFNSKPIFHSTTEDNIRQINITYFYQ